LADCSLDLLSLLLGIAAGSRAVRLGTEVGTAEAGTSEVGTAEVGTTGAGTAAMGKSEGGTAAVGRSEVGTAVQSRPVHCTEHSGAESTASYSDYTESSFLLNSPHHIPR
jgi:hypothetical protein